VAEEFSPGFLVWLEAMSLLLTMSAAGLALHWLWARGLGAGIESSFRAVGLIDRFLVQRLTWVFGTRWVKGRFAKVWRWSHLIFIFALLAFAGSSAPLWAGVPCLGFAYLGVLAIIRQWTWDEHDRLHELPENMRRVSGGEDLVNEAMFAGACLFLLTPILLFRLDQAFVIFADRHELGLFAYPAYTLGEFLKAVPLLDYSEVYGFQNVSGVVTQSGLGRHVTFAFRIVLDFLLIGGILQLFAVLRRVNAGRDIRRLQEALASRDEAAVLSAIKKLHWLGIRNQFNAQRALVGVLHARDPLFDPTFEFHVRMEAANCVFSIGRYYDDRSLLLTAIDVYRQLLGSDPLQHTIWSTIHRNLAEALYHLGARGADADGIRWIEQAIAVHRMCLHNLAQASEDREDTESASAMRGEYALTAVELSKALFELAQRQAGEAGIERLREAVAHCQSALQTLTDGKHRGEALLVLGSCQYRLGECLPGAEGASLFRRAIATYDEALHLALDEAHVAAVLTCRAAVLTTLGQLEGGQESHAYLEAAVSNIMAILPVCTPNEHPETWSKLQNNLALVFTIWGERTKGAMGIGFLARAADVFATILRVRTEERAPLEWAMAQSNLGNVLRALGERLPAPESDARLNDAVAACHCALRVFREDRTPAQWADAQNNLANALRLLGESDGPSAIERIRAAIDAYRAALRVRTEDESPYEWAHIMNNLGNAYTRLGARLDGPAAVTMIRDGIASLKASLRVRTEQAALAEWAGGQNNLGYALLELSDRLKDAEACASAREAAEVLRLALAAFEAIDASMFAEASRNGLTRALEAISHRCSPSSQADEPQFS
jgi:tetratricopeptide (TPR) repeat protein